MPSPTAAADALDENKHQLVLELGVVWDESRMVALLEAQAMGGDSNCLEQLMNSVMLLHWRMPKSILGGILRKVQKPVRLIKTAATGDGERIEVMAGAGIAATPVEGVAWILKMGFLASGGSFFSNKARILHWSRQVTCVGELKPYDISPGELLLV